MRRVLRLIVAAFLLGGWLLAAAAIHVIVLPGWKFGLLPKDRLGLTDTYVDARAWTAADAQQHPALIKRILEAGKADWLGSVVGESGDELNAKLRELATPAEPEKAEKTAPRGKSAPVKGPH